MACKNSLKLYLEKYFFSSRAAASLLAHGRSRPSEAPARASPRLASAQPSALAPSPARRARRRATPPTASGLARRVAPPVDGGLTPRPRAAAALALLATA